MPFHYTRRRLTGDASARLSDIQYESGFHYRKIMNPIGTHRAYIALGSNVGDRFNMIDLACYQIEHRGIHIRRTSSLYETAAMYLHDQPPFINGVCEVSRSSVGARNSPNSVHRY